MMPNTYALGYDCVDEFLADVHTGGMGNMDFDYDHATRLLVGAVIVSEIRAAVYAETGNIHHFHFPITLSLPSSYHSFFMEFSSFVNNCLFVLALILKFSRISIIIFL